MALSRNTKIVLAVGMTAAVIFAGAMVFAAPKKPAALPPGGSKKLNFESGIPEGLSFETRNVAALDAVVNAMLADPKLAAGAYSTFAGQLAYYGLTEQAAKLSAKAATLPKYTQQEVQSGITKLWEQQATQGFW